MPERTDVDSPPVPSGAETPGRSPHPDEDLLCIPFDQYERHAFTRAVVNVAREHLGRAFLRILDVGGGPGALCRFLPDDTVVAVDVEEAPGEGYIIADGAALPFREGAFDIAVAQDTLEHVLPEKRERFLSDICRVASELVVINGPFQDPSVEAAERFVMEVAKETVGDSFSTVRYLREHAEHGLPDLEATAKQLQKLGLPNVIVPNGALDLWIARMIVRHHAYALATQGVRVSELDRRSNREYVPAAESSAAYRQAVLASPRKDKALLRLLKDRLKVSAVAGRAPPDPLGALARELNRFTELLRAELGAKDDHARNLESAFERLQSLESALAEREERVKELEEEVRQSIALVQVTQERLNAAVDTLGYRLLEKTRAAVNRLAPRGSRRRLPVAAATRAGRVVVYEGWGALVRKAPQVWRWPEVFKDASTAATEGLSWDEQYQLWLRTNRLTPARIDRIRRRIAGFAYRPLVSIVMPTYNSDPRWLREAIESVRGQLYAEWELCIADDGSTRQETLATLRHYEALGPRIKVKYLTRNSGIAAASNEALSLAEGEFVGLLDHDDELKPDALYRVVRALNQNRELDFIYTDEDKKDAEGRLVEPFFKPDWSPDLLMSVNYVAHFSVFRREIIEKVGGFRPGYDGSQDYDLILRVTEITDRIGHIARPLYTWRRAPGSAAAGPGAKTYALDAARAALADALRRRGYEGEVTDGLVEGRYRVRYHIQGQPRVAIIIPTRDRLDMLRRCIDSIRSKSTYRNYEIVIVDNNSLEPETLEFLQTFEGRVLRDPGEFNFARLNNFGAREAGDVDAYLFLNNDTSVITPDWIESMLEHAQRKDVAAVGARLLYPDCRVQHEGIIIGLGMGSAGNVDHGGYFGLGQTIRNCSAVTAACMMTTPDVFWDLGGFDERLRVAFNDVDFCLRARQKGYWIVYTPHAMLYHFESASRGRLHPPEDEQFFRDRWGNPGEYRDPYYNPNLDLRRPFTIRV
jgi:GT2 family glycosyltransferase/SAM-dependent methyltransferase